MPEELRAGLHRRGWHFYAVAGGERLMCAWDTEQADVAALVNDVRAPLSEPEA